LVTTTVKGRSEGAPPEACGVTTDIVPNHAGISPSDTAIPYSVDLNDFTGGQYIPGDMYTSEKQCSQSHVCMHVHVMHASAYMLDTCIRII